MEKILSAYDKVLKGITLVTGVIAGLLVLFCAFSIVYEVVCRSILNTPTEWVTEVSTYCIVIAGFLGMGVTYAGRKHIHVDIFISRLTERTRTWIELGTSALGAFYCLLFTVESWKMVMMSIEYNNCAPTTLSTPLWIPQSSMPVGLFILLLHLIRTFLGAAVKLKKGDAGEVTV